MRSKVLDPLRNSKNIMRKHGVFLFRDCDRGACGALGATVAVDGSLVELFISL